MTLVISKGITLRNQLPADAEADAYIAAVEAADGQALEPGVKFAIKNFVLCCKQDGIWPAIKASCILAGARTLDGALVPLAGAAPTNFGFVAGDYNRKTGLVSNGTKSLNSNRNNNADPIDNMHVSVYLSSVPTLGSRAFLDAGAGAAGATNLYTASLPTMGSRLRSDFNNSSLNGPGLFGVSRSVSSSYQRRISQTTQTVSSASQTPFNGNIIVFDNANPRLAFYSIGESLDLALLDARVTDLINAFAAAIP
jgi:hypothetical protein